MFKFWKKSMSLSKMFDIVLNLFQMLLWLCNKKSVECLSLIRIFDSKLN